MKQDRLQITPPINCQMARAMGTFSKCFILFLGVCCLAGCRSVNQIGQVAVLKVDSEHFVSAHYSTNTPIYRIQPCAKIILDDTHCTFKISPQTEIVLFGAGTNMFVYQIDWQPRKARYELSGATLQPEDQSPPFDGFKSGQEWNVGVYADYETNKSLMAWYGTIEVQ